MLEPGAVGAAVGATVFGAAMGEMQVLLTLILIFLIILLTAVMRPYGEERNGRLLQKLEVITLCLLFLTLWGAAIFSLYPRCEIREGESLWWCNMLSVVIGMADAALIVVLVFLWLKGSFHVPISFLVLNDHGGLGCFLSLFFRFSFRRIQVSFHRL